MQDPNLVFQAPHLSFPQGLSEERVLNRVALRDGLERQSRLYEAMAEDQGFDHYRQAAISLLTNNQVKDAFTLQKADPKWLDRYGQNSFGWSLLMARQLVEAGVSLVQVNLGNNETWDTHQAAFPNLKNYLLPPMDRAVSALLDDLDSRGLLDETLIVMGERIRPHAADQQHPRREAARARSLGRLPDDLPRRRRRAGRQRHRRVRSARRVSRGVAAAPGKSRRDDLRRARPAAHRRVARPAGPPARVYDGEPIKGLV